MSELSRVADLVQPLIANRDYARAMQALATLRGAVDNFFDEVMVMAEDESVRRNRLQLLSELRDLFLNIADISLLVTK